ncbi:MAG: hypothetical protein GX101_05890 [Firmicutes bacterium]|jgi:ribosomal protein L14E/L6E/L27E|nr:KOW domain-containing RNA-binding protein [Bacillota bacterium]NLO66205.1 hypothetical protein [Bacillota bacterium]
MGLLEVGQLVTSKQGRDLGRKYVVIGCSDQSFVHLADGLSRTVERPKRKNIRHLVAHKARLEAPLEDKNIRAFIQQHSAEENQGEEGSTSDG